MNFPWLEQFNNAECVVFIESDKPSKNGDFKPIKAYTGACNLSEKSRVVRSSDGGYIRLNSVVHIKGDIAPDQKTFSGTVVIGTKEMKIETIDRPRNPDGTVHHTRLGLI